MMEDPRDIQVVRKEVLKSMTLTQGLGFYIVSSKLSTCKYAYFLATLIVLVPLLSTSLEKQQSRSVDRVDGHKWKKILLLGGMWYVGISCFLMFFC